MTTLAEESAMAAAAMTPRLSDTAFMPASLPGVNFTRLLLENLEAGCAGARTP